MIQVALVTASTLSHKLDSSVFADRSQPKREMRADLRIATVGSN